MEGEGQIQEQTQSRMETLKISGERWRGEAENTGEIKGREVGREARSEGRKTQARKGGGGVGCGEGLGEAGGGLRRDGDRPRHPQVSVCQEMLQELRHAVSCRKTSRSRRRRRPGGPSRALLSLRAVREMRLSNGKLYSAGAGGDAGSAHGGPQRLLDDPGPPSGARPTAPTPCTHVRVCQECRRIQALRASGAGAPPRGLGAPAEATSPPRPRPGPAGPRELAEHE